MVCQDKNLENFKKYIEICDEEWGWDGFEVWLRWI